MKVLHIYREKNNGDVGGVEHHIQYVAAAQLKLGMTPCVLTFSFQDKGCFTQKKRNGIDWYSIDLRLPFSFKLFLKCSSVFSNTGFVTSAIERVLHNFVLKRTIEKINEIKPDIIHQHDYLSSVMLNKKLSKTFKIIFTNHYGEYLILKKTRLTNYIQQRYFLNSFSAIIASSKELLPEMKNCFHISNGVDTNVFNCVSEVKKRELKIKYNLKEKITVLCARRWAPTKGVFYFASALNLLEKKIKENMIVVFAGNESDDFNQYKLQVQTELDKCEHLDIRFLGNLQHNQLSEYVKACDIGVIPSLMEGVSLFSLELVSCGIPVIGTNVGGIPEIIRENENGWLVPSKDSKALASVMNNIVTGWPKTNLLIDTDVISASHSWTGITAQINTIYKKN